MPVETFLPYSRKRGLFGHVVAQTREAWQTTELYPIQISEVHQTHPGHRKSIWACREWLGHPISKRNWVKRWIFGWVIAGISFMGYKSVSLDWLYLVDLTTNLLFDHIMFDVALQTCCLTTLCLMLHYKLVVWLHYVWLYWWFTTLCLAMLMFDHIMFDCMTTFDVWPHYVWLYWCLTTNLLFDPIMFDCVDVWLHYVWVDVWLCWCLTTNFLLFDHIMFDLCLTVLIWLDDSLHYVWIVKYRPNF